MLRKTPYKPADNPREISNIRALIRHLNEAQGTANMLNRVSGYRYPVITPWPIIAGRIQQLKESVERLERGDFAQDNKKKSGQKLKAGYVKSGAKYYKIVHRQVCRDVACYKK